MEVGYIGHRMMKIEVPDKRKRGGVKWRFINYIIFLGINKGI